MPRPTKSSSVAAPSPANGSAAPAKTFAKVRVVVARGKRLTPQACGLAASVGAASLRVHRRPRVACFFTGDELAMPGEPLAPGAIYNSNRFVLTAMLARLGCEVRDLGIVGDTLEATRAALREAAQEADLIVTSGGVSVGEEDHVKPAVEAEGQLDLWRIAMKPGRPLAYGDAVGGRAHFIGLPGNPVSSFVTFMLFVRPFVLRLARAPSTSSHRGCRWSPASTGRSPTRGASSCAFGRPGQRTAQLLSEPGLRGADLDRGLATAWSTTRADRPSRPATWYGTCRSRSLLN